MSLFQNVIVIRLVQLWIVISMVIAFVKMDLMVINVIDAQKDS